MEKLKCYLKPVPLPDYASAGLLALRLAAGVAFVVHGWGKIQTPFSWAPPGGPMEIPGFFQFLAALSEFGGGLAWIFGLLTRLASLGIAITMIVATYTVAVIFQAPYVNQTGGVGSELAVSYLGVALALLALGGGRFSLDAMIFGERD